MNRGHGRISGNPGYNTHTFAASPQANIPRSKFNRSHTHKTTFNEGYLVPVYLDEALPGDTFNCHMTAFARLSTPIFPIMDNMYLESFFFAVPYRLVWDNWEKFNGSQTNPGDSTDFILPTLTAPAMGGVASNSLSDYFGIPTKINSIQFQSLFHRAYNLIWNDWFRDENLQNSVTVETDDGPDTYANYALLQRGKRHDYFTSCLPWPQKGTAVELPLGTTAPIIGLGSPDGSLTSAGFTYRQTDGSVITGPILNTTANLAVATQNGTTPISATNTIQVFADLSEATAATINQLRQAFQIQKLYERDARGGTRYTEIIRSHFGVISPDMRLQRPEYLGGGSSPVNIHPVPQTSETDTTPQGTLAAYGTVSAHNHGFVKSFTEHCLLIGLVCVRADLNYQQGLNRMFSRSIRWDFYWPALSHIGEQAVLNQEIYMQGTGADTNVFGYQERYAEYRYKPSIITGEFRSNYATPLDTWHLAQDFGSLPTLGSTFIVENAPMSRILAVDSAPHFLFDSFFSLHCARPMPVYGVPGLIDHF